MAPLCPDILYMLFPHIECSRDVSCLMRTCHQLYHAGVRHLLQREGVIIDNFDKLDSFCHFILRDAGARAPLLRRLVLLVAVGDVVEDWEQDEDYDFFDGEVVAPGTAGTLLDDEREEGFGWTIQYSDSEKRTLHLLARVLEETTNLEELYIDYLEELLDLDDIASARLSCVLAKSPFWRHLSLSSLGYRGQALFSAFTAPLVEVNVDFYCNSEPEELLAALAPHCATLEAVTAVHVTVDVPHPAGAPGPHAHPGRRALPVFPRVRALALWDIAMLSLEALLEAFPALEKLELMRLELRDRAQHSQLVITNRAAAAAVAEAGETCWPALRELHGSLDALDVLGFARSQNAAARRGGERGKGLTLEVASVDIHPSDQPVLHEVLLRTRPTRLLLHVGHHTRVAVGDEVEAYEGLGELLDAIAGFEIEAFGLNVCAPLFEEATAECVGTLNAFVAPLSHYLHLKSLALRVRYHDGYTFQPVPETGEQDAARKHTPSQLKTSEEQSRLAVRLGALVPTLERVALDVIGTPARSWLVHNTPTGVVLQEVTGLEYKELRFEIEQECDVPH